jgi:hypothetical protein
MTTIGCFMLTPIGKNENGLHLYRDPNGDVYHLGNVVSDGIPPATEGAMWDAEWFRACRDDVTGLAYDRNPDGIVLCVRCPGGDWLVDGPSKGGGSWSRTGTVPFVTVTPSILQPSYHGWLRNGVLESC